MRITTNPLRISDIEKLAREVRNYFHIDSSSYFPIFDIIEQLDNEGLLNLVVLPDDDSSFTDNIVAYYAFDDNSIYISESIYGDADVDYRSNFTLAHELFHFIQNKYLKFSFLSCDETPAFRDPEWQANEFAGQLLIPTEALSLNEEEISTIYHVSLECALYRKLKTKKRLKNKKTKIDLHIHTTHSDGTFTPQEIIDMAKNKDLAYISITDHNDYRGSLEAYTLDPKFVIPGVEIDTLIDDIDTHILAYNFDYNNEEFIDFIDKNREMLFKVDDGFINVLINNGYNIDINDYNNYINNPKRGGWKALNYAIDLGIVNDINDYFLLMNKYNYSHASIPFPSVSEAIKMIHNAGGIAVLAHPYKTFPSNMMDYIDKIRLMGIDGIEVFYYKCDEKDIKNVYEYAKKYNLVTTVGNDYHGTFTNSELSYRKEKYLNLNLKGIIKG